MKRDVLQSNCQALINRLSTIGTTLKSICLSLVIGLIAAYYGSAFFKLFEVNGNSSSFLQPSISSMNYIWSITAIFFSATFIVVFCFAYLSSYYLSIERGYVNMYEYAGMKEQYYMLYGTLGVKNPLGTDEVDSTIFPILSLKTKEYGGSKWSDSVDYVEKSCGITPKSINELNEFSKIKRTRILNCFLSKSILPYYISIFVLSFSIIIFAIILCCFAK